MAEMIQPVSLARETQRRYLNYAVSVINARALPDVRDGLKPVQRRILYTMYQDLHLHADGRPRKCAKIAGDVTGNYHPHGTVPAYEALVRMAQYWVMRHTLVIGQGNFGSVDGDPPAADRYTEAKLSALADALMNELRSRTVDMRPNYDNTREEPVVLPAQFPNLLVNGCSGIAVGMATNIPPHNLGDVLRACIYLIDNPDCTTANLLDKVKGPDFPLGGKVVTDRATLRQIYEEGHGSIKVQGEWKLEEHDKQQQIIVTSIPYGVDKGKLENDIGAIIEDRQLPQLTGLTNESNEKEGLRIALDIKTGADPNIIMAYLYKHTELQDTFSYNMTCLIPVSDGEGHEKLRPERLGLKAILQHFVDFRYTTIRRRFEFELQQLERRIHILEGFRIVFNALDRAIEIIRKSSGKADAAEKLIAEFELSSEQTEAILEAQLYKIAQMEIRKILDELKEKKARATEIKRILASKKELWGFVQKEMGELAEKYGERRRTKLGSSDDAPEFDPEAYIQRENTNVVLTRAGWIKRVGRLASVEGTRVREGDEVVAVIPGSTLDHLVLFADDGTAFTMRINEVPASAGYGDPITKFFRLADQVKIVAAVSTDPRFTPPDQPEVGGVPGGPYVLVVTAQGQTLRTPLSAFRTASTKVGRRFVRLGEGDKVVMAKVLRDETSVVLASANGRLLHFALDQVNVLSGAGKGVIGIKLDGKDVCIGGVLLKSPLDKIVVETTDGRTKDFTARSQELVERGNKGHEIGRRTKLTRIVPSPIELVDWDVVEGKEARPKKAETNGEAPQPTLFD